jgi:hypothetical protein
MSDNTPSGPDQTSPVTTDIYPREWEVHVGSARVHVTDERRAPPPAQHETVHAPVHEEAMPKEGMQLASLPVDALYDVTVIGGGPTGLFAAFYAGMREMSVKIVDSLGELGGQVSALYPEKWIFDVAGFPQVLGRDLVAGCVKQGLQFGPTVCLGERVEKLGRLEDGTFLLETDKRHHHTHGDHRCRCRRFAPQAPNARTGRDGGRASSTSSRTPSSSATSAS